MKFLPVYDRAYNGSISNLIEHRETTEKEFFNSYKARGSTSITRDELRKIVHEFAQGIPGYKGYDQQATGFDDYWYMEIYLEDGFALFSFYGRDWYFFVTSKQYKFSQDTVEALKELVPPPEPPKENHVNFDFFMLSPDGTVKITRSLISPGWSEIEQNYQAETRRQIQGLVDLDPTGIGEGGKLVLLHGEPGLGKSYAIRALMRSMQSWAKPSYLMDPEKFFAVPTYMFDIVLNNRDDDKDMWRLIIAEDSDEFIRADAKDRTGQGLSRLLNLADGILGQGIKVIFLLTTNEPLKNLHPAVIRPGRCIANIEFKPFDLIEAREWLENDGGWPNNLSATKSKYSLAELFDAQRTHQQIKEINKPMVATGQYL